MASWEPGNRRKVEWNTELITVLLWLLVFWLVVGDLIYTFVRWIT